MTSSRRHTFTQDEIETIRELLRVKATTSKDDQKRTRARLRKLGFHITDFVSDNDGFSEMDLDALIKSGRVRVSKSDQEKA